MKTPHLFFTTQATESGECESLQPWIDRLVNEAKEPMMWMSAEWRKCSYDTVCAGIAGTRLILAKAPSDTKPHQVFA